MSAQASADEKHCVSCGSVIQEEAEICPDCGVRQDSSELDSAEKHCTSCGAVINMEAEICPDCGVRQETGGSAEAAPAGASGEAQNASEALTLMLSYYRANAARGAIHILIGLATGGVWFGWFFWFWLGTFMGWKNMEKLRDIHQKQQA